MASSPEPPADGPISIEAADEARRQTIANVVGRDAPDLAERVGQTVALLLRAGDRFQDGVFQAGSLEEPSLKQTGMAISSLLLRTRELAARLRSLDTLASELPIPDPTDTERLASLLHRASAHIIGHWPIPSWDIEDGKRLETQMRAVFRGCRALTMAGRWLDGAPGRAPWNAVVIAMHDGFPEDSRTALFGTGPDGAPGLLQTLPAAHKHVSESIYREDLRA